jgi:hypothetical protein
MAFLKKPLGRLTWESTVSNQKKRPVYRTDTGTTIKRESFLLNFKPWSYLPLKASKGPVKWLYISLKVSIGLNRN